jgi:NAD(P)H-dependent FMN reductase
MNGIVRVLGIAGSLRKGSFTRAALRAAQELVSLVKWTRRLGQGS